MHERCVLYPVEEPLLAKAGKLDAVGSALTAAILISLSILLVAVAALSLSWRMVHDAPILMYLAYLMDHSHYVPYRDFFDMNMVGTYVANIVLGRIFGYTDFGFRVADLACLAAISITTWLAVRRIGARAAWAAAVLFGLAYFRGGPTMSLQREYLLVLPLSVALALYSWPAARGGLVKAAATGFLFGLAATVKPQSVVGYPVVLAFHLRDAGERRPGDRAYLFKVTAASLIAFASPVLVVFVYLWQVGALPAFVDIVTNYLPLYSGLTGAHTTIFGLDRVKYLIMGYFFLGGCGVWLIPAVLGSRTALRDADLTRAQRRLLMLIVALAVVYSFYPVFQGQFWGYHYLLFLYCTVLLSSLFFIPRRPAARGIQRTAVSLVFFGLVLFLVRPPSILWSQSAAGSEDPGRIQMVDRIAGYLGSHLEKDDTVQPLDWAGGGAQAMLASKARLATRFVYDFHFYHHVSNPYIQSLRGQLIDGFESTRPRFVVQIYGYRAWPAGPDTTREFPQLRRLLDTDYVVVDQGEGYLIYELVSRRQAH